MRIRIKKYDLPKYLIYFELFWVCFNSIFINMFGMPAVFKYLIDLSNIVLLLYLFKLFQKRLKVPRYSKMITYLIFFLITMSFIFWIPKHNSILLLSWGARNTFRPMIFFLAYIFFMDMESSYKLLGKIDVLLSINFLLCIFQFFVLGYSGDNIGGGFGMISGCNAPLNVLLIIDSTYTIVRFMDKRINFMRVLLCIGMCVVMAGMAELKVYVIEILIIVLLTVAISRNVIKKLLIVVAGIILAQGCIWMIETLIPGWEGFFTLENMYNMVTSESGYTNSGDLNRFTSISTLNRLFFEGKVNLIGMGLGNCEFSDSFSFLNSTFFYQYGYLHYSWFSVAKIFLELGWFGIVFHIAIWGYTLVIALKKKKDNLLIAVFVVVISAMSIFLFIYNSTMNLDASYLMYASMAMIYIEFNTKNTLGVREL